MNTEVYRNVGTRKMPRWQFLETFNNRVDAIDYCRSRSRLNENYQFVDAPAFAVQYELFYQGTHIGYFTNVAGAVSRVNQNNPEYYIWKTWFIISVPA